MLDKIKLALRISDDTFDDELKDLQSACHQDLRISGVKNIDEADALVTRAIILYCKANFGFGDDKEKFAHAYEALKTSMSLSGDYRYG